MRRELAKHLSPKQRELAEVIGLEGTVLLSEHWPGVRLQVPHQVHPRHPIALAIGLRRAKKLCERYGGEPVTVPRGAAYLRALRNEQIVSEYQQGASARRLAMKYGLHENYIYALVGKHLADQSQGNLFTRDMEGYR